MCFSSKTKNALFLGSKMVLFKSQISNLYFCICFFCKRKLHANFHKKYWYLGPLEFFENENSDVRGHHNFGIGLLKSCLTFGYLTCSVRSNKNSTLHPNGQPRFSRPIFSKMVSIYQSIWRRRVIDTSVKNEAFL